MPVASQEVTITGMPDSHSANGWSNGVAILPKMVYGSVQMIIAGTPAMQQPAMSVSHV